MTPGILWGSRCPTLIRFSKNEDFDTAGFLEDFMNIVFWGCQPVEVMWENRSGLFLPSALVPKPPEWFVWVIDENGEPELRFLSKSEPVKGERVPDRFTIMCPRISPSYDNPYGSGVASLCFWPVVFKKAGMEFWLNMLERYGMPWIKGKTGHGATDDDLDDFRGRLEDLVQDAVVALSGDDDVEILSDSSRAASSEKKGDCITGLTIF